MPESTNRLQLGRLLSALAATAAAALLPAATALAEDVDYGRAGPYLSVVGSLSDWVGQDVVSEVSPGVFSERARVQRVFDSSLGLALRGGHHINHFFAAELDLGWLAGWEGSTGTPFAGEEVTNVIDLFANSKLYLLSGELQPYILFGLGMTSADVKVSGSTQGCAQRTPPATTACGDKQTPVNFSTGRATEFATRYGLGVDLYLSEHVALTADFRHTLPHTSSSLEFAHWVFNWGLGYRF